MFFFDFFFFSLMLTIVDAQFNNWSKRSIFPNFLAGFIFGLVMIRSQKKSVVNAAPVT